MKPKPCQCCGGTGKDFDHVKTGQRMRALRVAADKSLKEVASILGFSSPYLSDLEHGRRNWNLQLIERFEDACES